MLTRNAFLMLTTAATEDGDEVSLADRDSELLVFQAAYEAGLGPKFYGECTEPT